jgi:hypothetical protein
MRKTHHFVTCSSGVQPTLQPSGQLQKCPVLLSTGANSRIVPASKSSHVSSGGLICSQSLSTFVPIFQWKFGLRFRQRLCLLGRIICFILILDIFISTCPIIRPQTCPCGTTSIRLAKSRALVHDTFAISPVGKLLPSTISTYSDAAAPGLLDSFQQWNQQNSSLYSYISLYFHYKIMTPRRLRRNRKLPCHALSFSAATNRSGVQEGVHGKGRIFFIFHERLGPYQRSSL